MDELLKPLRDQIDNLDTQILELLNRRAKIAQEVGRVKNKTNAPIYRPDREAQVLRRIAERNPGPLDSKDLQTIYREIMSACRALERRNVIAFLGPAGTFSEQAVYDCFGSAVETLSCSSIDEVFSSVENSDAEFGVVPIENSTEGAINRTYDLFVRSPLTISNEVSIPIRHNLMTASGNMHGIRRGCNLRIKAHAR